MKGNVFRVANLRNFLRHSSDEFFRFDHARPEDKCWLAPADSDGANLEWRRFHSKTLNGVILSRARRRRTSH